jgi:transposase
MFIREIKKQRSKNSQVFYQYQLVQASRVDGKVVQNVILYLGSDAILNDKENRKNVLLLLRSKIFGQNDLFQIEVDPAVQKLSQEYYEKYCAKYGTEADNNKVSKPPTRSKAEYHNTDIKGLDITDVKSFGAEHLCTQMMSKLDLDTCLRELGMTKDTSKLAMISICGRAIFTASEYSTAQRLEKTSELAQCFNYSKPISHKQLYAIADKLYEHREQIDQFLYHRIKTLFQLDDRLVIFDISNSYFESRKPNSKLAKHGRSKEKRNDCPLVVFTGVINAEGFIRHSRIYEGNKADTATLSDMLADLKQHATPNTSHTVVLDAGIATEENLQLLVKEKYHYVCVSRKRIKDYEQDISDTRTIRLTDREKNQIELSIFQPKGFDDTWMYVQSEAKKLKEQSMDIKLKEAFELDMKSALDSLTKKGGTKISAKVHQRIGRFMQKHKRVSGQYEITTSELDGNVTDIKWEQKPPKTTEDKANGVYFIRTNLENTAESHLWDVYNTIREVEDTFRCLKSDLNIRPIHHQKDDRIKSHIYLTILAYQLVNTIKYMLRQKGIRYQWQTIVTLMNTQTIQTIEIPTDSKNIHLRQPSKPMEEVQKIYTATACSYSKPAIKKYVVYH